METDKVEQFMKLKNYYDMDDVNGMIRHFNGLLKEVVGQQVAD